MKKFELKAFFEELRKDEFVRKCGIPLGYTPSWPIFKKIRDKVVMVVPFNRIMHSTKEDVRAVLPIGYTLTVTLNAVLEMSEQTKRLTGKEEGYSGFVPVGFESLKYNEKFGKVEFNKPIGVFPHKDLREIGEEAYKKKVEALYSEYDTVINDLLGIEECAGLDRADLRSDLALVVDPATKIMYKMLDGDFADMYLLYGMK